MSTYSCWNSPLPATVKLRCLVDQRQAALDRGDYAAAAELDRPADIHMGRAYPIRSYAPAGRPSARWVQAQIANRPQTLELSPARQAARDAALRDARDRGGPSR